MPPDQRYISAGNFEHPQLDFPSGSVDFFTLSWGYVFTGENISANSNVPIVNWYMPAGFTAFASGTATGGSAMWAKISATAAHGVSGFASAKATTTSARILIDYWNMRCVTGR